jgi:hypothetical protein
VAFLPDWELPLKSWSDAHAKWLASVRKRTLDEQLEKFKSDGVAM